MVAEFLLRNAVVVLLPGRLPIWLIPLFMLRHFINPAVFSAGLIMATRMLNLRLKPPRAALKQENPRTFASVSAAKAK